MFGDGWFFFGGTLFGALAVCVLFYVAVRILDSSE